MCRMLGYIGAPVPLDHLLYAPDSSLIRQTVDPRMLNLMNLAGFGLAAWDERSFDPGRPFLYRSTQVPIFDRNLKALSAKVRASALVAHIRGVPYHANVEVNEQNLHPFRFEGTSLAMAHNGDLAGFDGMRFDLVEHLKPEIARRVSGSTDSEWLYALVLSCLDDPAAPLDATQIADAVRRALTIVRRVRERLGVRVSSSANLLLSDGQNLVATRFCYDFGRYDGAPPQGGAAYLSQWYTLGRDYGLHDGEWKMVGGARLADSVIVASEPLTTDVSTWLEVPEYSLLSVERVGAHRKVDILPLDV